MQPYLLSLVNGMNARRRRLSAALLAMAFASVAVIELLHGHECTGDGCVLCLVAACAHAVLVACVGVALARSAVRFLVNPPRAGVLRVPFASASISPVHAALIARAASTPVSWGICLRI